MKVEVTSVDQVRKKVEVILPEEKVKDIENEIYDELKKQAKIKGFRPGKTPRSIIAAYYKDYIEEEVKKRMVQSTMGEALSKAEVAPLTEPIVDFIDNDGQHGYTLECEIEPEIELPEYKGIQVETAKIAVTDEEVAERIEKLRNMHAEMRMKEGDAGAQKGDFVIIKYQGYMDGKPVPEIATEGYPLEMGTTTLLPEFEAALIGLKAGDEKEVTIDFPEDYPDTSIASKTIVFQVTVKEIREKVLPDLNEELAKDLSFESVEGLKESIVKDIETEKKDLDKRSVTQQIITSLIAASDVPVPQRLLERRIESMVDEAKSRFQGQGAPKLGAEEERALDENLKKEFASRALDRIKAEIILTKIARKEEIKVTDEEVEEKIKKFAEDSRRPYAEVFGFYQQYGLINSLRQSIIEEKAVDMVREHAVAKEKE